MKEKLSKRELMSYGLPYIGIQAGGMFMVTFLLVYYTDVVGLSALSITIMFTLIRVFDAINDPIIGVWMDEARETDYGKFRRFALIGGIGGAVMTIAMFMMPQIGDTGKLIYAYLTYGISGIFGTVAGIAYFGLPSRITQNQLDRTKLSQFKSIGGAIGGIVSMVAAVPLIRLIGQGNDWLGYAGTVVILSMISIVTLVFGIRGIPEGKVLLKQKKEKMEFKKMKSVVFSNKPFVIILFVTFMTLLSGNVRSAMQVYFFKYNIGNEMLISVMAAVGPSAMILASFSVHLFTKKFGKKKTVLIGKIITLISMVMLLFLEYSLLPLLMVSAVIGGIGMALTNITSFSMLADTVDFGHWKTGIRAEGTIYAVNGFMVKCGIALAGIVGGIILSVIGYQEMVVQPETTLQGIRVGFIVIPAMLELVTAALILTYPLTESKYEEIVQELKEGAERKIAVNE